MSVPVVPSKSADTSVPDSDNELAWPPPEDAHFGLDVMDLETRRVMTAREAGERSVESAAEQPPPPRIDAPRPISYMPAPAKRVARTGEADRVPDRGPHADTAAHRLRPGGAAVIRAAVAIIVLQAIVIAVFVVRGRRPPSAVSTAAGSVIDTRTPPAPPPAVDAARPPESAPHPVATTGRLLVRSDPPGAAVVVDGHRLGATPVSVDDLTVGGHHVQLGAASTAVEQTVTIEAGTTTTLVVPMASAPAAAPAAGWLSITSPIEVQVFENGRAIGTSAEGPLRLAPGTHKMQLVNDVLGYRGQENVTIRAGEMNRLRPALPDGVLNVNAQPWASVWIDGARVGDTPLANIKLSLGQHEIRFRHPSLGEQVRQVVVSATEPARVSVNMKP
jgi:PEGA domain-containing protein